MEPDTYESVAEEAKQSLLTVLDNLYDVGYSDGYTAGRETEAIVTALNETYTAADETGPSAPPCDCEECAACDCEECVEYAALQAASEADYGAGCFCGDPTCDGSTLVQVDETFVASELAFQLIASVLEALGDELTSLEADVEELFTRVEGLELSVGLRYVGSDAATSGE